MNIRIKFLLATLLVAALAACGGVTAEVTPEVIYIEVTSTPESEVAPVVEEGSAAAEMQAVRDVNLRAGDSTGHDVLTVVPGGASVEVIGRNSDGSWLQVVYRGATGWISASFLEGTVPADLPVAQAPAAGGGGGGGGGGQPASPTATTAAGGNNQAANPTATTAAAAQVAPADSNISVDANIKNQSSTHSDVISYPDGDTQDRVAVRVSGFDSNTTSGELRFTLTCTGTGVGNVKVTAVSSNGGNVGCNSTWTAFFTNVNTNHNITILLDNGPAAYVNWTLLITK
ncbi:MAG: SH3 domain-containing protein [Anaerolineales bacterium]|nr:SH3 domain-containing protein [Anaerolineales bacterium]